MFVFKSLMNRQRPRRLKRSISMWSQRCNIQKLTFCNPFYPQRYARHAMSRVKRESLWPGCTITHGPTYKVRRRAQYDISELPTGYQCDIPMMYEGGVQHSYIEEDVTPVVRYGWGCGSHSVSDTMNCRIVARVICA